MVVGAHQSFQFFRRKTFEIIDICLNLGIRFCITWLVLTDLKKLVCKKQFWINHAKQSSKFFDFFSHTNGFIPFLADILHLILM